MRTDKELADRVVALGVLEWNSDEGMYFCFAPFMALSAEQVVRDWQLAGALMESVDAIETQPLISIEGGKVEVYCCYSGIDSTSTNDSLPRAIIEACCEVLEGDK